ncbi:MAG: transcriptional repressor LexA [Patescibacteria group bacterium]|nr:transcriptional repressor LexA [Patescibacteria group bacterium]
MTGLTDRQKFILGLIESSIKDKGAAPTVREIQKEIGCSSPMGVVSHLKSLERKGYINRIEGKKRGIILASGKGKEEMVQVPLVGNVACGKPIWAEELIEDYIPISTKILRGNSQDVFMLRAKGDSMNLAGIEDSDYVIVRKQNYADTGEKVVALIGTEATVKKLIIKKDHLEFHPISTNKSHQPIIPERGTYMIQGKVIGVIKPVTQ